MHHFLKGLSSGSLEISDEEFTALVAAKKTLRNILGIEELFQILVGAYIDYEKTCLEIALMGQVNSPSGFEKSDLFSDRVRVNLRLMSLLLCGAAFTEQSKGLLGDISEELETKFSDKISNIYDNNFEYRIAYNLRNSVTHNSAQISDLWYNRRNQWETHHDWKSPSRGRQTIEPRIKIQRLTENKKTNAKVRDELKKIQETHTDLSVNFILRGYLACLSTALWDLREWTVDHLGYSLLTLKNARIKFSKHHPNESSCFLIPYSDAPHRDWLLIDPDKYEALNRYRKQWSSLTSIQRLFVSNELTRNKGVYPYKGGEVFLPD